MKITYFGHSCFQIETASHRLLIDPYLDGNPLSPVRAKEIRCDYILLSHGHSDHVGDAVAVAKANGATIVANFEIAEYLAAQGAQTHGMYHGGQWNFPFGRVKLTIAHHGSSLPGPDHAPIYLGQPAGLLIFADGKTVYHAGDTGLFLDMQLIGKRHPLDLALLPIGDNFTMGIDDAVQALQFLQPKRAVPMHYNTFPLIEVDPHAFVSKAREVGIPVSVLAPGEAMEL